MEKSIQFFMHNMCGEEFAMKFEFKYSRKTGL